MDKIFFSNSFKNLMLALGAKTSDSSYAVPLINKTSGVPQGYMDMPSLASVLGDILFSGKGTLLTSGQDLNNISTAGSYISNSGDLTNSLLNKPSEVGSGFVMICSYPYSSSAYGTQIIIWGGNIFTRYNNGSNSWGAWKKLQFVS